MLKPIRLPNKSADGRSHVDTIDNLSQHQSKYSIYPDTLFQPKSDRRMQKRNTAPTSATNDLFPYLSLREKSKFRVAIGRCMLSTAAERFFFFLIMLFAGLVVLTVAIGDNLSDSKIYLQVIQLVFLLLFLIELVLKFTALGMVPLTQVFFKDRWNIVDTIIVVLSVVLTVVELIPNVQSIAYLQVSAVLRLFRLVFTFRKTTEFRRIHHKLKKSSQSSDFSVEMAYERILELLTSFLLEPWVKTNPALVSELEWCIDAISSSNIYDTILTIKKESQQMKQADLLSLVKIFSANPRPESHTTEPKKRTNSLHREPLTDLKSDLSSSVLSSLSEIDSPYFDVFKLKDATDDNELVTLLHVFFSRGELYLSAQINSTNFTSFIRTVQAGYHFDNPYHNATHAADVSQGVHYFLGACGADEVLGLSPLELAGSYLAAAIHDYDHPGVNNTYLVNTQAELAMRYNDKSVLESHHVASAFSLTLQEDKDLFVELNQADYKHIREVMIEMVLSTDIAQHFTLLSKFRTKFIDSRFDGKNEDRILALSQLLHASDISNPSRPWPLCFQWASLVMEEFWVQGDKERSHGITVTYMMDRYTINVAKSQVGFIDVIVAPVFNSFTEVMPKFELCCQALSTNKELWSARVNQVAPDEVDSKSVSNVTKDAHV